MARLNYCPKTAELRVMMGDGRHEEARKLAIELLKEGYAAKPFLAFVAEMLDPPKRGKGAPARAPQRWIEIGMRVDELRSDGSSREKALAAAAEEFGCSAETARRAVRLFEDGHTTE